MLSTHSPSSSSSCLFVWSTLSVTCITGITKAFQAFFHLHKKSYCRGGVSCSRSVSVETKNSALPTQDSHSLRWKWLLQYSSSYQLVTELKYAHLDKWAELKMFLRFCIDSIDLKCKISPISKSHVEETFYCSLATFWQILQAIKVVSQAKIIHSFVKTAVIYKQIITLQATEHMRLTALRYDPKATEDSLSFPDNLLFLGGGCTLGDEELIVTLPF